MGNVELVLGSTLTDNVPYAYAAVVRPVRLVFTAGAELDDVARTTVYVASSRW